MNTYSTKISQLNDPEFVLLTNSQDTEPIRESFPKCLDGEANDLDSFFVKISNGDYQEIWGFRGIVASLDKQAYKIR